MENRTKCNILIIEDNPADAKLVEIFLNESTMLVPSITRTADLRKGLLMMEEHDFDIVLLDLTLPDSTGFDTVKTLIDEFPNQTVIVMTGLDDETVALKSVKAGAQDFIVKGQFDSNLLSRTITYAIERHQLQIKLENYARAIKLNEQRLLEAQKIARIGNWELDVVTNQMYWSEEVFRILGFKENSFDPGLTEFLKYINVGEIDIVKNALKRSMEKGQPFNVEYLVTLPGSFEKHIASQGNIQVSKKSGGLSLVGTIQDISAFVQKDQQTNNSALVELIHEALRHLDQGNGNGELKVKEILNKCLQMVVRA